MTNATEAKFGDPANRIAQDAHWTLLLRPKQPTLGSLVLVCREPVTQWSDVSTEGHAALRGMVRGAEAMLRDVVGWERINHLMLMMVDPDVHFHVIPRYAGTRSHGGVAFSDAGWPGPPALDAAVALDAAQSAALVATLRAAWRGPGGG